MKKIYILLACCMALTLMGCGAEAEKESSLHVEPIPVSDSTQTGAGKESESAEPADNKAQSDAAKQEESKENVADTEVKRKDGERFEDVIILEGMEETVKYEHAVNDAIGFEIDYDYESFVRQSESDKELFISIYDDLGSPENYLEITYSADNADTVIESISKELSKKYEINKENYELDKAGNCTRIDASADVGGATMPDQLQMVYIIPSGDGTVVGTAHYSIEAAEGFGRRFAYMMHTVVVH